MAWPAAERTMQQPKTSCRLSILLLLLPLCTFFCLVLVCRADRTSDAAALLAFKGNVTRVSLTTWTASAMVNVCSWEGIECNGTAANGTLQRVISVRLPGKSLYGSIPLGTIGSLDALDTLSLRSNKLTGSLPADLDNCALLRRVFLQKNTFSGPLPSDFSAWPLLQQLDLSSNSFNGSIPSSIGNLTHLKALFLQNNSLSGAIPPLDVPSSLQNFSVANNLLNGSIPSSLARFPASSFAGNLELCGPPLPNACAIPPISSPPPPAATPASSSDNKLSGGAIAGIVIGVIAFVVIVFLVVYLICRKSRKAQGNSGGNKDLYAAGRGEFERTREGAIPGSAANGANGVAGGGAAAMAAPAKKEQEERNKLVFIDKSGKQTFDLEDLLRASAEVLGKGSLGTAYKAMLDDGLIVAVKRLRDVTSDKEDYQARMEMLGRLRHENLVPLRAYYFAKQEKLLVFDYMPNGSLSALLHGNKGSVRGMLDWESRLSIAAAVARAVEYLHGQGVVHGNIKSANVLLSRDNRACLSDYGLVQLVTVSPGPASHKSVGYVAPEVTDVRKVTPKGDVYSFGVLLLELLTGRSPSQAAASEDGVDLPRWVQSVVREEWTAEVFDLQVMKFDHIQEEMMRLLQVALPCVATSPDQRPAISDVARLIRDLRKPPSLGGDDDVDRADDEEPHHQYPGRRQPSDDVDLVSPYQHHQYPGRFSEISSDL